MVRILQVPLCIVAARGSGLLDDEVLSTDVDSCADPVCDHNGGDCVGGSSQPKMGEEALMPSARAETVDCTTKSSPCVKLSECLRRLREASAGAGGASTDAAIPSHIRLTRQVTDSKDISPGFGIPRVDPDSDDEKVSDGPD